MSNKHWKLWIKRLYIQNLRHANESIKNFVYCVRLLYNAVIKTMSLTALAKLLTGVKDSVAGPRFFKYKGEWLNDIRHRLGV